MINIESITSGDSICIYNPVKIGFIQLDSNGQSIRGVWTISSGDRLIRGDSTITLLESANGRYLSCKQISIEPCFWIIISNNTESITSQSEIKLICQCHNRALQFVPSDEITNKNNSLDIWRLIHSDGLRVGSFASKFPIFLTTPIDGNERDMYSGDTNNFSTDKTIETILMSLFSLDCNNLQSNEINIYENVKVDNFHTRELINLSKMVKKCVIFVEEQIGYKASTSRVDFIRQKIGGEVYDAIVNFYSKLSNIDLSCNGLLNLNTELESEIELFTRLTNLIPIWNNFLTINFLPDDVANVQNAIYSKIYKTINTTQEIFYSNSRVKLIQLCNILGKVIPKHSDTKLLDEYSMELFTRLNVYKTPITTILHRSLELCQRNNFDTLFPDSYRVKYLEYKAFSREITETKLRLSEVWLNKSYTKNGNSYIFELNKGICLLRWRMRIYLDELDLIIKTRENNIPIVNGLEELIIGYKKYCNSLQFDSKLYDLIYECLQFSKYFSTLGQNINIGNVKEGETKLSELWTRFYKQCLKCSTEENYTII